MVHNQAVYNQMALTYGAPSNWAWGQPVPSGIVPYSTWPGLAPGLTLTLEEMQGDLDLLACQHCGQTETEQDLYRCTGCKGALYCGKACQELDAPIHSIDCACGHSRRRDRSKDRRSDYEK